VAALYSLTISVISASDNMLFTTLHYTALHCTRSKAFGLFVSVNWGSNLIISSLTLTAIELLGGGAVGVAYLYLIFAAISACAVAFVHACVHETMGRSLEELQMSTSRSSSATGAAVTGADDDEFDIQSSIAATAYRPLAAQSGGEEDDFDRHLQEEHV
jgi:Sugar (and other) transporter